MIPNEWQTLPPGIHGADWEEIVQVLGFSERRQELLSGLYLGLRALKAAGCQVAYIDGSFTTGKPVPGDFDVCYELTGMKRELMDEVLLDFSNFRQRQKEKFGGEFFPAAAKATPSGTHYLEFFQRNKHSQQPKGIIAINLAELE